MENKGVTLENCYKKALQEKEIHFCSSMELESIDVNSLFVGNKSKKFIENYFQTPFQIPEMKESSKKLKRLIKNITDFRAMHTVSSFLLGVSLKEELRLDIRKWIRIGNSHTSDATFGFFWSLICLTHDAAYKWERASKTYIKEYPDVHSFIRSNNIAYNLLQYTNYRQLIEAYYKYRIEQGETVDHGITGAILVYDALITFYEENKKNHSASLCGICLRDNFPDFCLKISETVALHNMWRATKGKTNIYRSYKLEDLISDNDYDAKDYYEEDVLRFLLELIDTIDPIKAFCNVEGSAKRREVKEVLCEFYIRYFASSYPKKFDLIFEKTDVERYFTGLVGMETWLGVKVEAQSNKASVSIVRKQNIMKETA